MKSERRHHLQQNELAGHLGNLRERLEPYAVPALVVLVVVLVAVIAIGLFQSRGVEQRADATLGLLLSTAQEDAESYNEVSTNYAGTQAATVATLAKADASLALGIDAMYTDREEAQGRLQDAVDAYQEVIDSAQSLLLQSRATYGLAQALESQGKLDEAIEAYQQVVKLNESEGIVEVAQQRIEYLQRPQTREFLAWFLEQKPTTFDPANPPAMPDAGALPAFPDFSLPAVSPPAEPTAPADEAPATASPADADSNPEMEPEPTTEPAGDEENSPS